MTERMNVLIVYADQWRAQACGYAGNRVVQTPHLDQFARQAVNCRRAVSGCPVCTPARASLLTGLYPHRHGLFLNDVPLNPELPSLGKVFRSAGYRTAWVGKWHVDGHGRYAYIPPERRQGFAYFKALECTHDYNHSRYYDNNDPQMKFWEGYDAFAQTEDLMSWLRQKDSRPFLATLSWGPPHNPYHTAPQQYRDLYDPAQIELPGNVPAAKAAEDARNLCGYYAHCSALDAAFGRLLAMLNETGLARRTLVLFLSDHGDMVGSHGLYEKQNPWDESIRVPFLLHMPGLKPGVSDLLIDHPDIMPTLCGLVDQQTPDGVQGRDLSAHVRNGTMPQDDCALLAAYQNFGNWPWIAAKLHPFYHAREFRGLRTRRYTYTIDRNGPWFLYDNEHDPLQQNNLVSDPSSRAVRDELAALLKRRMTSLGDNFEPGMNMVRRWDYQVNAHGTIDCPGWAG